jgi:hypothetical protein
MVIKIFLPLLVTALFLTGCFSVKSYVDPSFSTATYENIVPTLGTFRVKVKVEFQRDGEPYEPVNEILKKDVENALVSTGIIIPDVEATDVTMTIVVNNIPESGATAKGIGVGLTYGLAGTSVIDSYDVSIAYKEPSRLETSKQYQHAIRTTLGFDNGQPPFLGKVKATTTADAFSTLVEQVIIEFVADMQREGYLTLVPQNEYGIVTEVEYTSSGEKYTESIETSVTNISGTYVSTITSNDSHRFKGDHKRLEITFEQRGNTITGTDSTGEAEINGKLNGDTITFVFYMSSESSAKINGEWKVNAEGTQLDGSWKILGGGTSGQWNLKKVE